jgi:hypothetical protein
VRDIRYKPLAIWKMVGVAEDCDVGMKVLQGVLGVR